MIQIVTHGGKIHGGEIFAIATIVLRHNGTYTIARTRDDNFELIRKADYAVEIGGVYNPDFGQFGNSPAFGDVWDYYGAELCGGDTGVEYEIRSTLVNQVSKFDTMVVKDFTTATGAIVLLAYEISFYAAVDAAQRYMHALIRRKMRVESRALYEELKAAYQGMKDGVLVLENYISLTPIIYQVERELKLSRQARIVVYPDGVRNQWCAMVIKDRDGRPRAQYYDCTKCELAKEIDFTHPTGFMIADPDREKVIRAAREWNEKL